MLALLLVVEVNGVASLILSIPSTIPRLDRIDRQSAFGPAKSWLLKAGYGGCVALAALGLWEKGPSTGLASRMTAASATPGGTANAASPSPMFEERFLASTPEAPSVHASSITCLRDGRMFAAWFGGTREGARDVSVYGAHWDSEADAWKTPCVIVDAAMASRELGRAVKKVGNPVVYYDQSGRLWLFYVTVSLGGWSGSSVSVKHSDDGGAVWSESRRIISSPFLNFSTLVRAVPLELADGSLLLPVYHEFLAKYSEILHLSSAGELIAKYRMGTSVGALQPTIAAIDERALWAFHRRDSDSIPRVLANRSLDGGRTWSDTMPIDLPNPNASVAVIPRTQQGLLMALNASETDRTEISLATSDDAANWRVIKTLPGLSNGLESSYPTLIKAYDGVYHLTYTWGRQRICHIRFNDAWLEQTP